jgi:hypothetical protein
MAVRLRERVGSNPRRKPTQDRLQGRSTLPSVPGRAARPRVKSSGSPAVSSAHPRAVAGQHLHTLEVIGRGAPGHRARRRQCWRSSRPGSPGSTTMDPHRTSERTLRQRRSGRSGPPSATAVRRNDGRSAHRVDVQDGAQMTRDVDDDSAIGVARHGRSSPCKTMDVRPHEVGDEAADVIRQAVVKGSG